MKYVFETTRYTKSPKQHNHPSTLHFSILQNGQWSNDYQPLTNIDSMSEKHSTTSPCCYIKKMKQLLERVKYEAEEHANNLRVLGNTFEKLVAMDAPDED